MSKFAIIVDSTVDLPKHLLEPLNAIVVPLNVHIGEHTFLDYFELDADKLYKKMKELKGVPKTSAVAPALFMETFEKLKKDGVKEVLWVGIGNAFSATMQSARIAADEVTGLKIRLVDSHSLSGGGGLLALRAHDLREQGKSLDETADYLETLGERVQTQFIVDNLDMLAAGGRVTGMKLFFGRILRAHPYLQVNEDKLEVKATPKGKTEKALDMLVEQTRADIKAGLESPRIAVIHSKGGERVTYVIDAIKDLVDEKDIFIGEAGAVISSHCGEGTIGILYIRK